MDTRIAARFCVRGRVQGVGFRASTAREARTLGLDGHAGNRGDASVEVEVAGPAEAVDLLGAWLGHGPTSARVTQVERQEIEQDQVDRGFVVR